MKEKQPYEKPKMTFVENQPERRKEYLLDAHDPILVRCSTGSTGI